MAIKKDNDLSHFISVAKDSEIQKEFIDSPDRIAGIIGAAIIEAHLDRAIRSFLVDDPKEVENFISSKSVSAPISSFSAKARFAYCCGLIG